MKVGLCWHSRGGEKMWFRRDFCLGSARLERSTPISLGHVGSIRADRGQGTSSKVLIISRKLLTTFWLKGEIWQRNVFQGLSTSLGAPSRQQASLNSPTCRPRAGDVDKNPTRCCAPQISQTEIEMLCEFLVRVDYVKHSSCCKVSWSISKIEGQSLTLLIIGNIRWWSGMCSTLEGEMWNVIFVESCLCENVPLVRLSSFNPPFDSNTFI